LSLQLRQIPHVGLVSATRSFAHVLPFWANPLFKRSISHVFVIIETAVAEAQRKSAGKISFPGAP